MVRDREEEQGLEPCSLSHRQLDPISGQLTGTGVGELEHDSHGARLYPGRDGLDLGPHGSARFQDRIPSQTPMPSAKRLPIRFVAYLSVIASILL